VLRNRNSKYVRSYKLMREKENQYDLPFIAEELHRLFDRIPEIAYSAVPSERPETICFARRIKVLTGYTADEILADNQLWMNMIHPADRKRVFAAFNKCAACGIIFEIEYRIIHKDGSVHYVIDEGEPVFDDQGGIVRVEGIITGIPESDRPDVYVGREYPNVTEHNNVHKSVLQKT